MSRYMHDREGVDHPTCDFGIWTEARNCYEIGRFFVYDHWVGAAGQPGNQRPKWHVYDRRVSQDWAKCGYEALFSLDQVDLPTAEQLEAANQKRLQIKSDVSGKIADCQQIEKRLREVFSGRTEISVQNQVLRVDVFVPNWCKDSFPASMHGCHGGIAVSSWEECNLLIETFSKIKCEKPKLRLKK